MEKLSKDPNENIKDLEGKIDDLTFQLKESRNELKNKMDEFDSMSESHRKLIRKLIHNLKNTAGVIFSFSEMILEDVDNYDAKSLEKHVTTIKKAADFSLQFLNKITKFSRLQAANVTFLYKKLKYLNLLNKIVDQFEPLATEKKITIKRDFKIKELILFIAEEEMTQAISNVINNAIRYSLENTTITISVTEYENHVETVITDEGIGISEKDLLNIFDEFFVVKTYSSDTKKCIGLGLTMANKIVLRHNGKISASSTIDKGSSFNISIPKK